MDIDAMEALLADLPKDAAEFQVSEYLHQIQVKAGVHSILVGEMKGDYFDLEISALAKFIAAARTFIPEVIAYVRKLEAERKALLAYADEKLGQHGQTWNALVGQGLRRIMEDASKTFIEVSVPPGKPGHEDAIREALMESGVQGGPVQLIPSDSFNGFWKYEVKQATDD